MGYHANCHFQDCVEGCCNKFGVCPEEFNVYYGVESDSYGCYHYYGLNPEIVYGIICGISGLIILILIVLLCWKIKRRNQISTRHENAPHVPAANIT
jgi:uncharacterized membrane protein